MAHMHDKHSHDRHSHSHKHTGDSAGKNLLIATFLNVVITIFEFIGGLLSNSFALLSDALHNFGDTISVFLAYISNKISKRPPTAGQTFGFKRIEILAALINSIAMLAVCIYLFIEAYKRFIHPEQINGLLMIIIAGIGLIANLLAVAFLSHDKDKNLNVKAAYLHLMGDTLSSVAVVVGGIFIYIYHIWWLDAVLTFIIGIYILKETFGILKQAYDILMQATPPEIDINMIKQNLEKIDSIENIHHVHVWKLNDSQIHFECHVDLKNDIKISETDLLLSNIKTVLREQFSIEHTTIQFEYNCCDNKSMIY